MMSLLTRPGVASSRGVFIHLRQLHGRR
jgi:hypothetical protein